MTFLKKFGEIALKAIQVALGIQPLLTASLPASAQSTVTTVASDLSQLATIITQVEIFGQALQLPGAQKLTAAAPSVAQIILGSSLLVGKKIQNQALFNTACTEIAGGMADLLNSLDAAGVTVGPTVGIP